MSNHSLTTKEQELSKQAAKQLGISHCLMYRDGGWICDPRDSHRTLSNGCGSSPEEAIADCAKENGITL